MSINATRALPDTPVSDHAAALLADVRARNVYPLDGTRMQFANVTDLLTQYSKLRKEGVNYKAMGDLAEITDSILRNLDQHLSMTRKSPLLLFVNDLKDLQASKAGEVRGFIELLMDGTLDDSLANSVASKLIGHMIREKHVVAQSTTIDLIFRFGKRINNAVSLEVSRKDPLLKRDAKGLTNPAENPHSL